jgi:hypothetical protein
MFYHVNGGEGHCKMGQISLEDHYIAFTKKRKEEMIKMKIRSF